MENVQFKILSGDKEIFKKGTVITFDDKGITFKINEIVVKLLFEKDASIKEPSMKAENSEDAKILTLRLLNFENPLGTATAKPLQIGTIKGRTLFLNFSVHSIGDTAQKTVHYTFYFEKEVINEQCS
jgi:hypothetical protein